MRGYFRLTLKSLILLAATLVLAACTDLVPAGAPPTLKIGLVAPFEGLHRPLGYEALFGVKLALQERNLGQGLGGYRVELVALNDFDDPAEAKTQARALVADPEVIGVVGHLSSATTLAALPFYQEANMAVSVPWTIAAPNLDAAQAGVVSVAATRLDASTRLEDIGRAMGFNNFIEVTADNVAQLNDQAEALQLATDGVTAGEIILALRQANIFAPLFGQVDVGSPQLPQVAKTAANGLIFVSPGPGPGDVAGAEPFIKAYQALAGFSPGPRAVLAYDATHVLLDAIERAILNNKTQPSRAAVSAVITNIRRRGLSGDIAFDALGRRIKAPVWVYQISEEGYPGVLLTP